MLVAVCLTEQKKRAYSLPQLFNNNNCTPTMSTLDTSSLLHRPRHKCSPVHRLFIHWQIKHDQVSLKNVLASSPRTIWVPRSNCRVVSAGSGGSPSAQRGRGRFSKLDASRQEALTRTVRGLSAGARIPLARIAGLRAAVRGTVSLRRMRAARVNG